MMKGLSWKFLLFLLLCMGRSVKCDVGAGADASLFRQGRTQLSIGAGYGKFKDQDYFVAGLGAGYYLLDGLEAGLDGEAWVGSRPQIYNISPQIRYVLPYFQGFKPYIGGFYRRTFYTRELESINSAGGRAGLVFPLSPRTYLNAGGVYEHYFKCDPSVYSNCDLIYPEIGISFSY